MPGNKHYLYTPLGALESSHFDNATLHCQTTHGKLRLIAYSEKTFRFCATRYDQFDQVSYAVVSKPGETSLTCIDEDNKIVLKSSSLEVVISKNNSTCQFYSNRGQLINADDAGLGVAWLGDEVVCYKGINDGEKFLGLGEKTKGLNKRGNSFTNWNTDYFAYPTDGDPLYCSIPFYIGVNGDLLYGIFLDNSYKSKFNFGASNNRFMSFGAEGGDLNYYFISGESIPEILFEYAQLTGRMELPPLWSLGFQQCRYSYYPDQDVLRLAETFRDKGIPCDVIYLDIHYMEEYKVFTWDKERFPEPKRMLEKLKSMGFKVVVIMDPGVKVEEGYKPYDEGKAKDLFIKYPDGTNYEGEVWPGWCHFPDFTKAETRNWWAESMQEMIGEGLSGFWNDMNEFSTWGQDLPNLMTFDYEGETSTTKRARNVYGMQMARSTNEGSKRHMPENRPFILTRAGFAGIQRYAAVWTGDNVAYDDHMNLGIRMVTGLGLSGVPFAGYDIGGFVGEPSPDLYARWMALAAFSPFFRSHTMINSRAAEPWSFGEKTEEISRNFIKLRYKLMPYIYSLFYEASQTGMPISRALPVYFPTDESVYSSEYENQFLFGQDILVVPIGSEVKIAKIYLPSGTWYSMLDDKVYEGAQSIYYELPITEIPLFIKESAILALQKPINHAQEEVDEVLELHLYNGAVANEFELYEDAGDGYDYQQNQFSLRKVSFDPTFVAWKISQQVGEYSSKYKRMRLVFHGLDQDEIQINGERQLLSSNQYSFTEPISKYDPFEAGEVRKSCSVREVVIDNSEDEILIK